MTTAVLVVAALVALGSYLLWLAGRLDRLQVRVEAARASLDAQLVRRAAAASEAALAAGGADAGAGPPLWARELRDSAAAVLAGAGEQEAAESALTRAIRTAIAAQDPSPPGLVDTSTRVRYARQFHNDAVHASLALRRRRVIRYLRLWGTARAPAYFEIDDTL